jgi:hypothetical protein
MKKFAQLDRITVLGALRTRIEISKLLSASVTTSGKALRACTEESIVILDASAAAVV